MRPPVLELLPQRLCSIVPKWALTFIDALGVHAHIRLRVLRNAPVYPNMWLISGEHVTRSEQTKLLDQTDSAWVSTYSVSRPADAGRNVWTVPLLTPVGRVACPSRRGRLAWADLARKFNIDA